MKKIKYLLLFVLLLISLLFLFACNEEDITDNPYVPQLKTLYITSVDVDTEISWTMYKLDEEFAKSMTTVTIDFLDTSDNSTWSITDNIYTIEWIYNYNFDILNFDSSEYIEDEEIFIEISHWSIAETFTFSFEIRVANDFVAGSDGMKSNLEFGHFRKNYLVGDEIDDLRKVAIEAIWADGTKETIQATDPRVRIIGFDTSKVAYANKLYMLIGRSGLMLEYNVNPVSPGDGYIRSVSLDSNPIATFWYHDSLTKDGSLDFYYNAEEEKPYGFAWSTFNKSGGLVLMPDGKWKATPYYTFPYSSMTSVGYKSYLEDQDYFNVKILNFERRYLNVIEAIDVTSVSSFEDEYGLHTIKTRDLIFNTQNDYVMFTFLIPLYDDGTVAEIFETIISTIMVLYYPFH